jgi:hypothetical protein
MTVRKTPPLWGHFFSGDSLGELEERLAGHPGEVTRYLIDECIPVIGPAERPVAARAGGALVRVEDNEAWPSALRGERGAFYLGRTQHVVYTTADQKTVLDARSRPELAAGTASTGQGRAPRAVIIPLRKRAEWWRLAQDQRQASFHTGAPGVPGGGHGPHTAIGLEYVDRIFRRLYHSRHLGVPLTYDFVTYFEFDAGQEDIFRALLAALRDPVKNPEWAQVEWEHEIWMTKLG